MTCLTGRNSERLDWTFDFWDIADGRICISGASLFKNIKRDDGAISSGLRRALKKILKNVKRKKLIRNTPPKALAHSL